MEGRKVKCKRRTCFSPDRWCRGKRRRTRNNLDVRERSYSWWLYRWENHHIFIISSVRADRHTEQRRGGERERVDAPHKGDREREIPR